MLRVLSKQSLMEGWLFFPTLCGVLRVCSRRHITGNLKTSTAEAYGSPKVMSWGKARVRHLLFCTALRQESQEAAAN